MDVEALLAKARKQAHARDILPSPQQRRSLRERSGLAQGDLARVLGVSASAVCRYETGERTPRSDVLHSYLELLGHLKLAFNDEGAAAEPRLVKESAPHGRHVPD